MSSDTQKRWKARLFVVLIMKKSPVLLMLALQILFMLPMHSMASKKITPPNYRIKPLSIGIQKIMHDTLKHTQRNVHIGMVVQSMNTGKVLYQKNAQQLFTPASVQKILTAVAALDYLKPHYTFKTRLLTNGIITHHVLRGDLFLKFSGDPDLTDKDIKKLIVQLHRQGIRKITGHVFIDNSEYGAIPYPPGWIWDDLSYSFAAPLNTIIINRNYFLLRINPPKKDQPRPTITTTLPPHVATFSNLLEVVRKTRKHCPILIYSNNQNHYRIRGCFYAHWKRQTRKIAIRNMVKYTQALLTQLLHKNHIPFKGRVGLRTAQKKMKILAEHSSPPLFKIVKEMLKESDNLMTNAVFKKLGQTYFQGRGTWQNSLRAIRKLLHQSTGIDFKHNLVNDGAGLSRYNLLSPRQLSKVLYFAYRHRRIHKPFINALPIAGIDGTLEYRLRDQRRGGRIRAKTGTMTGVTALAGYIHTKHRGMLSFVIMMNGFVTPRKPYLLLEDQICRYLVNVHGPS